MSGWLPGTIANRLRNPQRVSVPKAQQTQRGKDTLCISRQADYYTRRCMQHCRCNCIHPKISCEGIFTHFYVLNTHNYQCCHPTSVTPNIHSHRSRQPLPLKRPSLQLTCVAPRTETQYTSTCTCGCSGRASESNLKVKNPASLRVGKMNANEFTMNLFRCSDQHPVGKGKWVHKFTILPNQASLRRWLGSHDLEILQPFLEVRSH